jgi:hypothetical protein
MSATDLSLADLDAGGTYRYRLTKTWDRSQPQVTWVMLNPSTATADTDDPTIRRVVGFSRRWGFGSAVVVNLFALRATQPGGPRCFPLPRRTGQRSRHPGGPIAELGCGRSLGQPRANSQSPIGQASL